MPVLRNGNLARTRPDDLELEVETGPELRYTNAGARQVEESVTRLCRQYNDDLYDLVTRIAILARTVQTLGRALVAAGVRAELVQDIINECERS